MKGAAGSEMMWTTYHTSEKYQINSPFLWCPISPPSLSITRSLLNFESTTTWNVRDSPLSCVLQRDMFISLVETQWLEKQRNRFWKKRERGTANFDHKISSPPTQICLWWFADCFVQLHENIFPLFCFQEACLVVLEQHPCLVNNSSSKQQAHFLVRRQEGCSVHQHQAQHPQVLQLALALEEPRVSLDRVLLDKQ